MTNFITDYADLDGNPSDAPGLVSYLQSLFQSILVSGSNIKTVNGQSLLGSGDISIVVDLSAYLPLAGGTLSGNLSLDSHDITNVGNLYADTVMSGGIQVATIDMLDGYQLKSNDLTAIANLAGTSGLPRKTGTGTWVLDTNTYYTASQVDSLLQGLDVKASVRAATTANITLSGLQTVDGVSLAAGDRVLAKNQTTTSQNGIYLVSAGAWTRAADMDAWAEVPGAYTFVEEGTVNADTGWVCTSNAGGTIGTTAITWSQFSGVGSVTAGTGITVTGTQVSLASGVTTPGTYRSVTVDTFGRVTAGTNPTTLAGYGITDSVALTTGNLSQFASTTSAQLAGVISDETGSGALVFGTAPTLSNVTLDRLTLSGNVSRAAWTTNGVGIAHTTRTLTDTTSSGTVAAAYTNVLGGNTIAASSATTFTEYASLFIGSPTAGTNVTLTNPFSIVTGGAVKFGGSITAPVGNAGFVGGGIIIGFQATNVTPGNIAGGQFQIFNSGTQKQAFVATQGINLASDLAIRASSTTSSQGSIDATISRASANTWQMGDSSNNANGSLNLTNLTASGYVDGALRSYTFAGLPLASANARKRYWVTDSTLTYTSANLGSTPSGGGANGVPVISNGSAWIIG